MFLVRHFKFLALYLFVFGMLPYVCIASFVKEDEILFGSLPAHQFFEKRDKDQNLNPCRKQLLEKQKTKIEDSEFFELLTQCGPCLIRKTKELEVNRKEEEKTDSKWC